MRLLEQYAQGSVPKRTISRLTKAFSDLRALADDGKLLYPYSTRELTNIVRHLSAFERDSVGHVLKNVFDFDAYDQDQMEVLQEVFFKQGIPVAFGDDETFSVRTGRVFSLSPPKPVACIKAIQRQQHASAPVEASERANARHFERRQVAVVAPSSKAGRCASAYSPRAKRVYGRSDAISAAQVRSERRGACALGKSKVALAVSGSSFLVHIITADQSIECATYDIHAALPRDSVYRSIPKTADVFSAIVAGSADGVLVHNPEEGYAIVWAVSRGEFLYYQTKKKGTRCVKLTASSFALWQKNTSIIIIINTDKVAACAIEMPFSCVQCTCCDDATLLLRASDGRTRVCALDFASGRCTISDVEARAYQYEGWDSASPEFDMSSVSFSRVANASAHVPGALSSADISMRMAHANAGQRYASHFAAGVPERMAGLGGHVYERCCSDWMGARMLLSGHFVPTAPTLVRGLLCESSQIILAARWSSTTRAT